uniref:uncharacterized protein LOC120821306 isoform X2 n=1 Tax=Gasterosteus aculeatus aculeatus TaxID=481459 RepID=UPI001A97F68A|nr:uncharacterized protein LOC120821306 isoform X2 [Gasterosteus aculeatus aculeatus]
MTPNETVTLNSANANDAGLYELACGTDTDKDIQPLVHVHVFLSTNRTVTEGDSVSFESYANTRGRGVFTVARNEKPVFELDYGSGKQTHGPGFEDRVSISPQWKDDWNLTMTLKGATTADEGVYFFYVRDKLIDTVPLHAARLKVNTRVPDQTTSGPDQTTSGPDQTTSGPDQTTSGPPRVSPPEENVDRPWVIATVVLGVVLSVVLSVVLVVGGIIFWCRRSRRPEASPESPDEEIHLQPPVNGRFESRLPDVPSRSVPEQDT